MTTYVLHDPRRPDEELMRLVNELRRQGLPDYSIVTPQPGITVEASINASHKQIIRLAMEAGLPEVCVLESDVCFPATDGWRYYVEGMPEEFDIYLGGVYNLNRSAMNRLAPGTCEIHNFAGLHCYVMRARFYERFLSVPGDRHIDTILAGMGMFYVRYPFAAIQYPGWSANNKKNVDYNTLLRPEDVYRGEGDPGMCAP